MTLKEFFKRKIIPLTGLLLSFVLVLPGCSMGGGKKLAAIKSFSYGHGGMSSWDCYQFRVQPLGGRAQIELSMTRVKKPLIKEADPAVLEKLRTLLENSNALSWDGFNGPNPPGVLDGTGFSLNVVFADGQKISARGSNNFPKGFGPVAAEIRAILEPYRQELLVREGFIKPEIPPAHLSMVYLDEWRELDSGTVRTRRAYLSPQDERKYPKLAAKLSTINEAAREKDKTVIISVVRADNRITSLTVYEKPSLEAAEQDCSLTAYNYYTETGEEVVLSALSHGKKDDFCRLTRNGLRNYYGEKALYPADKIYEDMRAKPEKLVFSVGHEAAVVYFQPGEVAAMEKGLMQVERAFMYDWQTTKEIKTMPETWASGLVAAMDVFTVVSDPKLKTRMKRVRFTENPWMDTRNYVHAHFGFEKDYLYEFYYEDGVYTPGRPRLERVYRLKGGKLELIEERDEAALPEADADDYSSYIFGPTDIYPAVTDTAALKPPQELSQNG